MKLLILILSIGLAAQTPNAAQTALKAAIDKEVADGDIESAIVLYGKVAADFKSNKSVAAQALLRLGQCHEKLGQADAAAAYNRVIAEYGDQKEAGVARGRLAAIGRTAGATATMSVELLFSEAEVDVSRGRVSLDGLFPYVGKHGNIYVRDLRTGISRQITTAATAENREGGRNPIQSRDGSRIAYVWNDGDSREVRVISTAGGTHRTIVRPSVRTDVITLWDWAPDGKTLVGSWFQSGERAVSIVIIDAASGAVRKLLTHGRELFYDEGSFSTDGRQIAVSVRQSPQRVFGLRIIDTATGRETPIVQSSASDRSPVWLPQPGKIVFSSDRWGKKGIYLTEYRNGEWGQPVLVTTDTGNSILLGVARNGDLFYGQQKGNSDVYFASVDPASFRLQGTPHRFIADNLGHNSSPVWSPSGASFAYISARDLNSNLRAIVRRPADKEVVIPEISAPFAPNWCSESRLQVRSAPLGVQRIYDVATGGLAQPERRIEGLNPPYQITSSPDCSSFYVTTFTVATQQRRIYRVDAKSPAETEVYADDAAWSVSPKVSPDGRWLALIGSEKKDGPVGLIVLPTAGGKPRMLAEGALSGGLSDLVNWTPDSKHIFFARRIGGELECFAAPIDGGPIRSTGIRGLGLQGPSLHPDGKQALFSLTTSTGEVWSLRSEQLK